MEGPTPAQHYPRMIMALIIPMHTALSAAQMQAVKTTRKSQGPMTTGTTLQSRSRALMRKARTLLSTWHHVHRKRARQLKVVRVCFRHHKHRLQSRAAPSPRRPLPLGTYLTCPRRT